MLRALFFLLTLAAATAAAQEMVIAPQYDGAGTFEAGLAPVKVGDFWGLVDRTGKMIVEPRFVNLRPGRDGLHPLQESSGFWRFLGSDGEASTWSTYHDVQTYKHGWTSVKPRSDEAWLIIDVNGRPLSSTGFDEVIDWDPPFAIVRDAGDLSVVHIGDFGYVNPVEQFDLPAFTNATQLSGMTGSYLIATTPDGMALLDIRSYGFRPELGLNNVIFTSVCCDIRYFKTLSPPSEGYVAGQALDGNWGFYHLATSRMVWAGRFDELRSFSEGYAAVKRDGKWGYINRRGEVVVQPIYDRAYDFHDGFAVIRQGDLRGFLTIDPDRGIIEFIAPQYQDVFRFREGLAPVKQGNKWGFVSNGQTPDPALRQTGVEQLVPD